MKKSRLIAGAAALGIALASGPALATGAIHTVSVAGTNVTATPGPMFSGVTAPGTTVVIRALSVGGPRILDCSVASTSGTIQPGTDIIEMKTLMATGCVAPGGPSTDTLGGTWKLHSANPYTASSVETVVGHLDDVVLNVRNTANQNICRFTIRGSGTGLGLANTTFDEATQRLSISEAGYSGNLQLQNVTGCGAQLQNGNPVNLSATFNLTAAGGALNITS